MSVQFGETQVSHCVVVAEIGNVHDGSLGECYALAEAAKAAGADAVKYQMHFAEESTEAERFPRRFSFHPQDQSRMDYWLRMSFSWLQWKALRRYCESAGLKFIVSVFSEKAVNWAFQLGVDWIKIASGELSNTKLIQAVAETGLPVILSTGFAKETDHGVDGRQGDIDVALQDMDVEADKWPRERLTVLQCCTAYPTPPEWVGLNVAERFSRNLCYLGGISDHSGEIWPGVMAAVLGASMVEVHLCWDKRQFACDATSSLTIDQFTLMVRGIRYWERCRAHPVDKNKLAERLLRNGDVSAYVEGKRR